MIPTNRRSKELSTHALSITSRIEKSQIIQHSPWTSLNCKKLHVHNQNGGQVKQQGLHVPLVMIIIIIIIIIIMMIIIVIP